jgi:hypothetical protein
VPSSSGTPCAFASAGGVFQPKQTQLFRRGAHKRHPGGFTGFGEGGVFRQKAVAGMDSLAPLCFAAAMIFSVTR